MRAVLKHLDHYVARRPMIPLTFVPDAQRTYISYSA